MELKKAEDIVGEMKETVNKWFDGVQNRRPLEELFVEMLQKTQKNAIETALFINDNKDNQWIHADCLKLRESELLKTI